MSRNRKIQTLKVWLRRNSEGQSRLDKEYQTYKTELKETKKDNLQNYNY
tara:strand:- start:1322 stop:1468 length:147 start_codon:yes stop_codon:yes gene_type:complete